MPTIMAAVYAVHEFKNTHTHTQTGRGFTCSCQKSSGVSLTKECGEAESQRWPTLQGTWTVKFLSSQRLTNHLLYNFPHTSRALAVRSKTSESSHIHPLGLSLLSPPLSFLSPPNLSFISQHPSASPLVSRAVVSVLRGWCYGGGRARVRQGSSFTDMTAERIWAYWGHAGSTHVELVWKVSDKTEVRHSALLNYGRSSSLIWEAGHPSLSVSHFIFPSALQRVLTRTAGAKNSSQLREALG